MRLLLSLFSACLFLTSCSHKGHVPHYILTDSSKAKEEPFKKSESSEAFTEGTKER